MLLEIVVENGTQGHQEEEGEDDDKLNISDELVDLNSLDVHVIGEKTMELDPNLLLDDIEVLA